MKRLGLQFSEIQVQLRWKKLIDESAHVGLGSTPAQLQTPGVTSACHPGAEFTITFR